MKYHLRVRNNNKKNIEKKISLLKDSNNSETREKKKRCLKATNTTKTAKWKWNKQ